MVPEPPLAQTEHGLVPEDDGWFVVNTREALPGAAGARLRCAFEGEPAFPQLGVSLYVLEPGEPIGMYHWEADQEDFLVLDGEALLIVEGEERPLGRWDFVHCPAGANHIILGAGERPCVVLAVGARANSTGPVWGGYRSYACFLSHGRRAIARVRFPAADGSLAAGSPIQGAGAASPAPGIRGRIAVVQDELVTVRILEERLVAVAGAQPACGEWDPAGHLRLLPDEDSVGVGAAPAVHGSVGRNAPRVTPGV